MPECKAAGKPEPTLQLYDNNANCIQAILAGRADTYVNDVNTVDQAVKANPGQAGEGDRGDDPLFGRHRRSQGQARIPRRRDGRADRGPEGRRSRWRCSKKWELDPNNFKEPDILTVK